MTDVQTPKQTRIRKLNPDSLTEQIKRLPLEAKVKLLADLKASIEADKEALKAQLALIED